MGKIPVGVNDELLDASLIAVTEAERPIVPIDQPEWAATLPWTWYEKMFHFLNTGQMPEHLLRDQRKCLALWSRSFELCIGELYYRNVADVLLRCVISQEQEAMLREAHCKPAAGGHFSGRITAGKILQSGLWWPTLKMDAHRYVKNCDVCQRMGQPSQRDRMPLHQVLPLEPFQKWGLDFIGPFKPAAMRTGNWYILTAMDYCTKWVEAWALRDNTALSMAKCLFCDVFTRFGCLVELVSDRGGHFINKIIRRMAGFFLVLHKKSSPYYPQANGLAKSSNKQIVRILKKLVSVHWKDWDTKLPAALWAYHTAFKVATGMTPFKLDFGLEAITPVEFIVPSLWIAVEDRLLLEESLLYCMEDLETLDKDRLQSFY